MDRELLVQQFIRSENIKLYRSALTQSADSEQRRVLTVLLRVLLAEERAESVQPTNIAQTD
jgi:hypothetical protein